MKNAESLLKLTSKSSEAPMSFGNSAIVEDDQSKKENRIAFQEWMLKKQGKQNSERTVFKNISNCSIVNVVINGGDTQSVSSVLGNITPKC